MDDLPYQQSAGLAVDRLARPETVVPISAIAEGVLVYDDTGTIIDANDQALAMFGLLRDDLVGRREGDFGDLVRPDPDLRAPVPVDPVGHVLATGQPLTGLGLGVASSGGGLRWLTVNIGPLRDGDGGIVGAISTLADVSAAHAARRAVEALSGANEALIRATSERGLFQKMCEAVVDAGRYRLAWIARASGVDGTAVEVIAAAGTREYLYPGIVTVQPGDPRSEGPVGRALQYDAVQVINDIETREGFMPWLERARSFGMAATVAVPIFLGENERFALAIYAADVHAFDDEALRLLTGLAEDIRFGITHLRAADTIRRTRDSTVHVISHLLEVRDPYTAGHQIRVATLAAAIAADLGLGEQAVDLIRLGAEVHDVGKIAVPSEILSRPGRLTRAEFNLVKTHCRTGAGILDHADLPATIVEIAGQHHERLDGSGYPDGRRGHEISIAARIVAVADVVEAVSQDRPYRPALGIDKALAEISRGSGLVYDSDVVASALGLFDRGFVFGSDPAMAG